MQAGIFVFFMAAFFLAAGNVFAHEEMGGTEIYDSVSIAQPTHEETVFDNNGDVEIIVDVSPPVRAAAGDRVILFFDGLPLVKKDGARFQLSGVDRGAHTVQAKVTNREGEPLAASEQVTFYMWQASRLFPHRRNSPLMTR